MNGHTIVREPRDAVTYWHVELPEHAVILAQGLPVESYLDVGDRANFHQNDATVRLFPAFAARLAPEAALVWETCAAARLVLTGEKLDAARLTLTQNVSIVERPSSVVLSQRSFRERQHL